MGMFSWLFGDNKEEDNAEAQFEYDKKFRAYEIKKRDENTILH